MAAAGCGAGADRDARSRAPDSAPPAPGAAPAAAPIRGGCTYITEAEASAALGQPSRFRAERPSGPMCIIEPAVGDAFHGTTVTFRISRGSTAQYDFFAAQKSAQPVSGLGDRALWLPAGSTRGNLVVVRGTDVVSLTITDLGGRGRLPERARAVAQEVVDRL